MSWSVSYVGKPHEAKEHLAPQFASCKLYTKHIPHEQNSVYLAEMSINNQLDFLIQHRPDMRVSVSAGGSAGVAPEDADWKSYSQTNLETKEYIDPV